MAIYHCQIKIISRGQGRSAVAAAAYRSGTKLHFDRENTTFDFSRKTGVIARQIFLPDNAPKRFRNRSVLWNEVETIEKNSRAQLSREFEVAIPQEFTREQQKSVVKEFCQFLTSQGMICDAAFHDKGDGNPHAHIMTTMRSLLPDGSWAPKAIKVYHLDENGEKVIQKRDKNGRIQYACHTEKYNNWDDSSNMEIWRAKWAEVCNKYLDRDRQIDHRSYVRQGIDKVPTIHEGYAARQMEQRGEVSDRCKMNREIIGHNAEVVAIITNVIDTEKELKVLKQAIPESPFKQLREQEKIILSANEKVTEKQELLNLKEKRVEETDKEIFSAGIEVQFYQMVLSKAAIVQDNRSIVLELETKRLFGKSKYQKEHQEQIDAYNNAIKWLSDNGYKLPIGTDVTDKLDVAKIILKQKIKENQVAREELRGAEINLLNARKYCEVAKARFSQSLKEFGIGSEQYYKYWWNQAISPDELMAEVGEMPSNGLNRGELIQASLNTMEVEKSLEPAEKAKQEHNMDAIDAALMMKEFRNVLSNDEELLILDDTNASEPMNFKERLTKATLTAKRNNEQRQREIDFTDDYDIEL